VSGEWRVVNEKRLPAMFARLSLIIILCSVLSACRGEAMAPPAGTGAREVVAKYFEALAQQDWETAYNQLHADTHKRMDRAAFERNARAYCKRLGFPLGKVFMRSCDEQGAKAIAQVILSDATGSMKHRYHEGAALQQETRGWRIVLPGNFGQQERP
jgi:hypothetical protein